VGVNGSNVIGKPDGGWGPGRKVPSDGSGFSYGGVVRQQPGRKVPGRARRRTLSRAAGQVRRRTVGRAASRVRGRTVRGAFGRIRVGTAGASPRLRRWVLAAVLIGVALLPYPSLTAEGGPPAAACRSGCRAGSVSGMIKWIRPLSGSWQVIPGLTGTVPASGLAYVAVGYGVAAVGAGLTLSGYSATTGAPLWEETLTGFPAGAAIVSVRTWPGEVTAGVAYTSAGQSRRTEVVVSGLTGIESGRYPAATFGGAVGGSSQYTVIVGPTAVTSYDNATGRVRWRVATGAVQQAWRTDDGTLYVAESAGGFLGSAPVTGLRQINLATGAQILVQPLEGLSFAGTFSAAFDGVVLFSTAGGVTAYSGATGARLWSIGGAVPEGTDPRKQRIYLTRESNLIAVNPLTGQVTATISGSVGGSAGLYAIRDGVALGLDQGANGDAWGYDIGAQRVTLTAAGLPWPHYFVDLSGVGGSADPASDLVVIAACAQLAPSSPASPSPSSASPSGSPSGTPASTPAQTATAPGSSAGSGSASSTPSPSASPSAPGQGCLRPELVALNL
jgi:PQQ-like domain